MSDPATRPSLRDLVAACRALTPVVVDVGRGRAKLASYLQRVEGRGDHAALIVSPIATDAMPDEPDRVVVRTAGDHSPAIAVHARGATVMDDRTVRIPLAGATFAWMGARACARRVVEAKDPMILVVSSGVDGTDVQRFPVVDLSRDACSIEAGEPPPAGTVLDPVEIVNDRSVVRVSAAMVEEVIPWRAANGAARFRCRLRLSESRNDRNGHGYDLVTDPARVRRIVELAAAAASHPWIDVGHGRMRVEELTVGESSMSIPLGHLGITATTVRMGFELFQIAYELQTRVVDCRKQTLTLAVPLVLRRRRRRREHRIDVPESRAMLVRFYDPISESVETREVLDLSPGGLAFRAEDAAGVRWAGMRLESAQLVDGGRAIPLGDLELRHVAAASCHCALVEPARADQNALTDVLASLKHPELSVYDGEDFRGMLSAYRRANVLYEYMTKNLEPVAPSAAYAWRQLHKMGRDVVRTLLHADERGSADATVTAVRAWDQGWLIQHFGAVKGADQFRWSGELQRAIVEHVMLRPDGRFLFFFVNEKNASMNAFYERFFEATGTSEAIEHGTMDLWALPPGQGGTADREPRQTVVRAMRPADEPIVSRAAERALGPRTAAAVSLLPGAMRLPQVAESFRAIGIERGRTARIVSRRGRPELALMSERTSPGVNLAMMLSAHWLVPIHGATNDGSDDATHTALRTIEAEPAPTPYGERFVFVPGGCFAEALSERGWECRMETRTYVMNRAGLQRYYLYVADRYGAAEARSAKRRLKEKAG